MQHLRGAAGEYKLYGLAENFRLHQLRIMHYEL